MQNYFKKNKFAVNFKILHPMLNSLIYYFSFFIFKIFLWIVQFLYFTRLEIIAKFKIYFLLKYIFRYRKVIICKNIEIINSNYTKEEQKTLLNSYYWHLSDLFMETLWCFGANKDKIYSKVEITNMNVFEDIFLSKKNATILLSHIGNWELFCQWSSLFIPKLRVVTLFTPIKNALLNDIIQSFRGRFGTVMISTKSTLNLYRAQKTNFPCINLFAVDQNPGAPDEQLWLDFFNKKVPVISGAEKFAKSLEQEVYFLHIEKRNKKYELRLEKIDYEIESDNDVTKKQMKLLENNILKDPSLWLLSHNRFKFLK